MKYIFLEIILPTVGFILGIVAALFVFVMLAVGLTLWDVKQSEPYKIQCESKGGEWVYRSHLCFEKGTLITVLPKQIGDTK